MKARIIVIASSSYPIPVLNTLLASPDFEIPLVITRPDKPVGRKKIVTPNPVKEWASKNNIEVTTPDNFKGPNLKETIDRIKKINPDLNLVAHFGIKIPQEIFKLPKYETLNIHFSLLPKYRGGAPLEHTIINGDTETGITILKLDKDFDTGDIIYQESILLIGDETVEILYNSLFQKTAKLLPEILNKYLKGELIGKKQQGKVVYAFKKDLGNGRIDWKKSPQEIERLIRSLDPNPGTWTEVNIEETQKRLKILKSHLENNKLVIDEVQLEGKTPVSFSQFQKTYSKVKIG